jgi:hypothetical protein
MTRFAINIKLIYTVMMFSAVLGAQVSQEKRQLIDREVGASGAYNQGAYKVTIPRDEATIVWDDQKLTPSLGLNSWGAFKNATHDEAILTGQFLLLADEVDPVLAKALESGLEVTGLAPSSLFDGPALRTLDVSGTGTFERLASGFRACLNEIHRIRAANGRPRYPAPDARLYSSIDPAPLDQILGLKGTVSQGAYEAVTGTKAALHGEEVGGEMGMSTWVSFTGNNDQALMHGQLVVDTSTLQRVLRAISQKRIPLTAIRNHTVDEHPQLVFVHFWGTGRAAELAAAIRHILDVQAG